jgi:glycosyltransferase involved in cell wall biosynthesis
MPSPEGNAGKSLTVVVPTLNSAGTLDWTLASFSAAKEIRVIIADSFSVDDTLNICRRWDVETVSVPPGNMYAAINVGLRMARTDWLAYVNSDDWVFTASYLKMLKIAMQGSADIVYGSADFVDESGRFLFSVRPSRGKTALGMLRAGYLPFCQPAAIFRRTTFETLNGFDERYRAASDFDFYCRAALLNYSFSRVDLPPVAAFRLHQSQISVQKPHLDRQEKEEMKARLRPPRNFLDKYALYLWQFSNISSYAGRVLRTFQLSGKVRLQRSHSPQQYD